MQQTRLVECPELGGWSPSTLPPSQRLRVSAGVGCGKVCHVSFRRGWTKNSFIMWFLRSHFGCLVFIHIIPTGSRSPVWWFDGFFGGGEPWSEEVRVLLWAGSYRIHTHLQPDLRVSWSLLLRKTTRFARDCMPANVALYGTYFITLEGETWLDSTLTSTAMDCKSARQICTEGFEYWRNVMLLHYIKFLSMQHKI